jgi:hypothetical protein
MGVSVWIMDRSYNEHPDWTGGLAGERELWHFVMDAPSCIVEEFRTEEAEALYRPVDFAVFRQHPWADYNQPHWAKMTDILEANPDYWLHFST